MEAILTIGILVVVTALSVVWHLRRSGAAPDAAASARPCPRCHAAVPAEAEACPACGVPSQVFELVSVGAAGGDESVESEEPAAALHAVVRTDRCVGCGTCVAACPEPGAITLRGKLATVDRTLCVGHADCAAACPVGAIALAGGAAVQRVEVPEVDSSFQTSVPGIYVVGELGGRGLIKNAINEGKVAAEAVAAELAAGPATNPDSDASGHFPGPTQAKPVAASADDGAPFDLAVVGSGPAGLSAALEAQRQGLRYVVLEQGTLADTIRKYPRHKLLLAEPVRVPLYGDLWVSDASKETLIEVWETIVERTGLRVRTEHKVETITREDGLLRLRTNRGAVLARRVILALGRRGSPRKLGVPGEDAAKVLYDVVEMEAFTGSRVLVVGGGDTAIESALGLANQSGTTVHLSYRGEELKRVKERNRVKFEAAVAAGKVVPVWKSRVLAIRDDAVDLEADGGRRTVPNDYVIVRIGGEPPYAMLERIGVRIVRKDVPLATEDPQSDAASA